MVLVATSPNAVAVEVNEVLMLANAPIARTVSVPVASVSARLAYTVGATFSIRFAQSTATWTDASTFALLQAVARYTDLQGSSVRSVTTPQGTARRSTTGSAFVGFTLAVDSAASARDAASRLTDTKSLGVVVRNEAQLWSDPLLQSLSSLQYAGVPAGPVARTEVTFRVTVPNAPDADGLQSALGSLKRSPDLARALAVAGLSLSDDFAIAADGTRVASDPAVAYAQAIASAPASPPPPSEGDGLDVVAIVAIGVCSVLAGILAALGYARFLHRRPPPLLRQTSSTVLMKGAEEGTIGEGAPEENGLRVDVDVSNTNTPTKAPPVSPTSHNLSPHSIPSHSDASSEEGNERRPSARKALVV